MTEMPVGRTEADPLKTQKSTPKGCGFLAGLLWLPLAGDDLVVATEDELIHVHGVAVVFRHALSPPFF